MMRGQRTPWLIAWCVLLTVQLVVPPALAINPAPGDRGPAVAGLQRDLQAPRYDPGKADGVFGEPTSAAVQAFQSDAGTAVDGVARALPVPVALRKPAALGQPGHSFILGYYTGDTPDAAETLATAGSNLDAVAAFAYRLRADGSMEGAPFPHLMAWAEAAHRPVLAVVHNAAEAGFSGQEAARLLLDHGAENAAVEAIYTELVAGGYAGVQLDLENLPSPLGPSYTDFVRQLANRLHPAGLLVTVAVPARTGDREVWWGAYDYAALGGICDYVSVMAYDQHSPVDAPGPVAGLDWVRAVLAYATHRLPAAKLLLGVAGYGYDWTMAGQARAVTETQATALARTHGAKPAWDEVAQESWFRYGDGALSHTVYVEDARSLAPRLQAAQGVGAAGISLWRLGLEDLGDWAVIAAARR